MRVQQIIELLKRFDPEAEVRLSVALPDRVLATHDNVWVADYGGGPQLIAGLDFRPFQVYVGCGLDQWLTNVPPHPFDPAEHIARQTPADLDLGEYENEELAAKVRDFFNYHRRPGEPLTYPDFDYASWIAPRTTAGEYNQHVAAILSERLLKD
jgi:hypothetical protein